MPELGQNGHRLLADSDPEPPQAYAGRGRGLRNALWNSGRPLLVGLVGALIGIYAFTALRDDPTPASTMDVGPAVATAIAKDQNQPAVSAEVYQAILPSLVFITTGDDGEGGGLGTGVIINQDGSILTAYHVVDGATSISVTFADGTRATAQIATSDPENDLAVLTADGGPEVIVPAVLAGSGGLHVGDEAYAAGNPLGLVASLTAGVISGLNREITTETGGTLSGLIQFDAAVNPGSSGGPLLNRAGQVVGIVTALANPSKQGSFTGIGFAVPLGAGGGGTGGGPPR